MYSSGCYSFLAFQPVITLVLTGLSQRHRLIEKQKGAYLASTKKSKMKKMTKITSALRALLVCGFLCSASFLRAQNCNITINNNLGCPVQLDIEFFETIPPCSACSGNPINVTIGANGSTSINCGTGGWGCTKTICDILATFTNPVPSNPGPHAYNTGPALLGTGLPPGCGASSGANITVGAITIDINP
jgi:hypothetical protein